ncbi:MAG: sulfur oxidation c-type cytochrome SoxA [Gammaproteobacteria bacterium]|nr:MAG: sulfur oxidation c-type cytochrome SoxA [Gammaproteobacteria bacterium]
MKKILLAITALGLLTGGQAFAKTDPEADLKAFRDYFYKRFPDTAKDDFINGVYSIDPASREQWEAIEEFPPYELNISNGEIVFNKKFKNGKSLASCFKNGGKGIKQNYPYFDAGTGKVKTLEQEINECLEKNGEKPFKYKKGKMADVSAYMTYTSRGKKINVVIPDDPRAIKAYEAGKRHFYAKRGQLNFSCADCHVYNAGNKIRADLLSPALGHVSHFPVYRSKWGGMGTMHRRYGGCNKQVRAKPFKAQSDEYRNLEYFHTYMSNGLEVNGPGARK